MYQHLTLIGALLLALLSTPSFAAKTYSEDEFLDRFGGKPKAAIESSLGKPSKTAVAVRPTGAKQFMERVPAKAGEPKSVHVDMWYYNNLVRYDHKHTYRTTELTFVNNRVANITFINDKR